MYADVSRRMADGYPSSYNNLAALLPIIGKIAKTVFPALAGILPGVLEKRRKDRQAAFETGEVIPHGLTDVLMETGIPILSRYTADKEAALKKIKKELEPDSDDSEGTAERKKKRRLKFEEGPGLFDLVKDISKPRRSYGGYGGGGGYRRYYRRRSYGGRGGYRRWYRRRPYGGGRGYRRRYYRRWY